MPQVSEFAEAISTTEAAHRYQVTRRYVSFLAQKGAIKAIKIGRDWIVDASSLRTYLISPQKRGPKPQTHNPRTGEPAHQS